MSSAQCPAVKSMDHYHRQLSTLQTPIVDQTRRPTRKSKCQTNHSSSSQLLIGYSFLLILFSATVLVLFWSGVNHGADAKAIKKLKKLFKLKKMLPYLLMAPKIIIIQKDGESGYGGGGSYGGGGYGGGGYGGGGVYGAAAGYNAQDLMTGLMDGVLNALPTVDLDNSQESKSDGAEYSGGSDDGVGYGGAYQHHQAYLN